MQHRLPGKLCGFRERQSDIRLVLTQLKKFFWYSLLDQLRLGTFKRTQAIEGAENFLLAFFSFFFSFKRAFSKKTYMHPAQNSDISWENENKKNVLHC